MAGKNWMINLTFRVFFVTSLSIRKQARIIMLVSNESNMFSLNGFEFYPFKENLLRYTCVLEITKLLKTLAKQVFKWYVRTSYFYFILDRMETGLKPKHTASDWDPPVNRTS